MFVKSIVNKILEKISQPGGISATDLAVDLAISRSAVRHHLQVLEQQGLITQQKQGKQRLYFMASDSSVAAVYSKRIEDILAEAKQIGDQKGVVFQKLTQDLGQKLGVSGHDQHGLGQTQGQLQVEYLQKRIKTGAHKPKLAFINYFDLLEGTRVELTKHYELIDFSDKELIITPEEFVYRGREAEVIVNNWGCEVDAELLSQLPNLQYMHLSTHSHSYVDLKAAQEHGVRVSHFKTDRYKKNALLEYLLAQTFALLRKVESAADEVAGGVKEFRQFRGEQLRGKCAAVFGTNDATKELVQILKNLGLEVIVHNDDKFYDPADFGVSRFASIADIHAQADIVYFLNRGALAFGNSYYNLDKTILSGFKKPVYIVSVTKHEQIDYGIIRKLIMAGRIKGIAFDFLKEFTQTAPLINANTSKILYLPNVLITPDISWYTNESVELMNAEVLEYLLAFVEGDTSNMLI
jgi:D-3-phosphoglycerate dehydrogenase